MVVVIPFNPIQLLPIEVPIMALKFAPTPLRSDAREWIGSNARQENAAWGLVAIGARYQRFVAPT